VNFVRAFLRLASVTLCALLIAGVAAGAQQAQKPAAPGTNASSAVKGQSQEAAGPVSKHYPILIVAHGTEPTWSLRLGMKGPERLDRVGYPPVVLDSGEISNADAADTWTYRAKDTATGADVSVTLKREACSDVPAGAKYTFSVLVQHAQIGMLRGCGQSAPDQFPEFRKKNQIAPEDNPDDKDKDKDKKSVLDPITKFTSPVDTAYLDAAGKVIFSHGAVKKTVAAAGDELAVSHDGKKLLYTRSDSKTGPERSIVLYDFETGRSRDVATGNARSAFWSPDDSRVAFLKFDGKVWQVWTAPVNALEKAAVLAPQEMLALQGWTSPSTVLATDMNSAYWLSDDKPPVIVALKEIYGDAIQNMSSNTLRANPVNADLLLISGFYEQTPVGAPTDSMGLNSTLFLYEVRTKRRTTLLPASLFARDGEWSRDGLQIFFTAGVPGKGALATDRVFWDGSGLKRFVAGSEFVVGK
jgi:uncharacterized membrane protein